ncbi:site-specific integrase [Phocaeicola plebeius]|jgi:integrase/recombinase XerD|uniref:Site-specific integrase n=1 Tax=Phocaeicola plebeius TaxID=310297 RepID=A0A415JBS1_9BACT|nr:site-specific integrase [Phocaeicola plebeius]RHK99977.1 site-specific integrase [Phocaeicola plebeius]RHL18205.1 site-specific integrase [Phocaeicola plebeius]
MIKVVKNGVVVSVLLDTRTVNKEGTYPVKIKVYFQGKPKYYSTGICMSTKDELEEVLESKSKKNIEIQDIIGKELSRILKNVDILVERGTFSFSNLNNMLGKNIGGTLNEMISAKIKELENEEKFGTSAFYKGTLSLLKRYMKHDVPINEVTVEWLNGLEKFILKTASQTTVAMNMRNIRATMNIAKQVGVIRESDYPFGRGKYQIKEGSGKKKALNKKQLKAIAEYSDGSMTTEFYRDLWLFIYFCNGLNVADLISLKFSDIQNGEISFIRKKTKDRTRDVKRIYAAITPEMYSIINKWGNDPKKSIYIFPFLKPGDSAWEHEKKKKNLTKLINKRMKMIGEKLNLGKITTYVARHTYATVLRNEGVPISIISPMLGHSSVTTTEIYLADLESEYRAKNASLLSF